MNVTTQSRELEKFRHPLRPPSASFTQGMGEECFKLNCSPRIISFMSFKHSLSGCGSQVQQMLKALRRRELKN